MPLKKSLSQGHPPYNFGMRLFLLLPLLSLMTSCATFIPGLDRILFSKSSAKVGPLVIAEEPYPATEEENVLAPSKNEPVVEPVNEAPEPIGKTESNQKPGIDTEPEPAIQTTGSRTVSSPRATDTPPPITKVKPNNNRKSESPSSASPEIAVKNESMGAAIKYGTVIGKVVLVGENGQLPATDTMITLTPKKMMGEKQDRPSQVHIIDMKNKAYQPRYSTIHAGDQVVFVNKDNIRHNVFSSSGNNGFDLGTYGAGLKRAVTLKEPGVVKIYCNIHPEMATFIAVGNQGLSVRADDQGRYQIGEVLPGTYEVTIWNIRGETKREVEVKADETVELVDRIDTTAFSVEPHKNKFGGNYSKNSTLFEDEFY